jgi:hypothetical protein
MRAKAKDPSGGTTGRVKLYGRLGWMGARAEYSLDGEGKPLPHMLVAEGSPNVQMLLPIFLIFWQEFLLRGGAVGSASGRLAGRLGGSGLIQPPGHGNVLPIRNIFSSRPVRNCDDRHRWRSRGG